MKKFPTFKEPQGSLAYRVHRSPIYACASTEHHAMKAYWGSGGISPRILDLGSRWTPVVSFTPRPLYPQGKTAPYPLDRRLGGPQSRSGHGEEEKIPSSCRYSNPRSSSSLPDAMIVSYPGSSMVAWQAKGKVLIIRVCYCTGIRFNRTKEEAAEY
jgi:hypothetical protein